MIYEVQQSRRSAGVMAPNARPSRCVVSLLFPDGVTVRRVVKLLPLLSVGSYLSGAGGWLCEKFFNFLIVPPKLEYYALSVEASGADVGFPAIA